MKKLPRFLAVLTIIAFASTSYIPSFAADGQPRRILSGWIPYYSTGDSLRVIADETNKKLIKDVMPFWFSLKYDSKTKLSYIQDMQKAKQFKSSILTPLSDSITSLRGLGYTVVPTITDGTAKDVLASLLAGDASRKAIIEKIVQVATAQRVVLIQKPNSTVPETSTVDAFDGVDLDFEGFAFVDSNTTWKKTAPIWTKFIKELAVVLHAKNKLLSVSTPYVLDPSGAQKGYYVYNWAGIASSIDRLRIMTYDYSVSKAGPLGPITWTERTVKYATTIMPPSKVFLGLPGYGRDWITDVKGVCPASVASVMKKGAKASTFTMGKALEIATSYGVAPQWNDAYAESTFTYQKVYNGNTAGSLATSCTVTRTAWYQDAKSFQIRSALVDKYRLGGVAVWTFSLIDPLAMQAIQNVGMSIAPDQVNANLTIDKSTINYGDAISLNGNFAIKDKTPLANIPVIIQGRLPSEKAWRTLATATTDFSGNYSKKLLVGRTTVIRVHSDDTWERNEGNTPEFTLSVNRLLFVSAPQTLMHGETATVTGSIRPREASRFITIEKLSNGAWKAVGKPLSTDAQGNFVFSMPTSTRGILTLRVTAAADSMWSQVSSAPFSIVLR
jgi:spore germination protein YaaH